MISSWYKNIIIIFLSGLLLIDLIGGYALAQGDQTSIMIIYKGLLAASISIYLTKLKSFWFFIIPTIIFILLFSFSSIQNDSLGSLGEKLALFFRFIFNSIVFIFLVFELQTDKRFVWKFHFFIFFSYLILTGSILLGALGWGNNTYSDAEVGSKGYFEGGNDIGVAYLVLGTYLLYRIYTEGKSILLRICFIFLHLTIALLASTKLVILGSFIGVLYILWRYNKQNIWVKYIYIILTITILAVGVYVGIQSTGLMERILTNLDKGDVLFVLLSGRDNTVIDGFSNFSNSNLIVKFFGFPIIQNSEMDGFDILFNFGFIGVIYFITLAILLFRKLKKMVRLGFANADFGRFIFVFSSALGFLAGHTLFSTQGGLFLLSVVAMSFYNPLFYVQK